MLSLYLNAFICFLGIWQEEEKKEKQLAQANVAWLSWYKFSLSVYPCDNPTRFQTHDELYLKQ